MSNWIYIGDDINFRFVLGEQGSNPLVCFGINPSTATPVKLDQTLTKVRNMSLNRGYNSWIMLNIYPQRATDPSDLHTMMDKDLHGRNIYEIQKVFQTLKPQSIWAAWGTVILKRIYFKDCLNDIFKISSEFDTNWYHIGKTTKEGHPRHPLYLSYESDMHVFDIETYIQNMS